MLSSGVSRRVALIRADIWEESIASIIRMTRFGVQGTTLTLTGTLLLQKLVESQLF
jgi:hypothetical protein